MRVVNAGSNLENLKAIHNVRDDGDVYHVVVNAGSNLENLKAIHNGCPRVRRSARVVNAGSNLENLKAIHNERIGCRNFREVVNAGSNLENPTKSDISKFYFIFKNIPNFAFPIDYSHLKDYIEKANNLKAIHNKDYSVVKTFRAARKRRSLLFLQQKTIVSIVQKTVTLLIFRR